MALRMECVVKEKIVLHKRWWNQVFKYKSKVRQGTETLSDEEEEKKEGGVLTEWEGEALLPT